MSTSSTPIRVDTREVGHNHVLLPTLECSMPVPGLTGGESFRVKDVRRCEGELYYLNLFM